MVTYNREGEYISAREINGNIELYLTEENRKNLTELYDYYDYSLHEKLLLLEKRGQLFDTPYEPVVYLYNNSYLNYTACYGGDILFTEFPFDDNDITINKDLPAYTFLDYQVKDYLEVLANNGSVIFVKL